jgi:tyrosyl-tRNA synthetase
MIAHLTKGARIETNYNEFRDKLAEGRPLVVKYGIDPTGVDVHLGHTVPLRILRRFQEAGHQATIIIGDFTAQIGDPSGRNETRPPLSRQQINENMKGYLSQIGKFIDMSKVRTFYNSTWCHRMRLVDVLAEFAPITAQRMLDRDDFSKRLKEQQPVYLHEFIYPVIQGIDSREIHADVELGGTEQLYTLLIARDIQQRAGQPQQTCITVPILRGLDGKRRMGKSLKNYVGINDSPADVFGKTMSIPDELLQEWYDLLTDQTYNPEKHPKGQKLALASILVTQIYDKETAAKAQEDWETQFSKKQDPSEITEVVIPPQEMSICHLLVASQLAASLSEARRAIIPNPKTDGDGSKSSVTLGPDRTKILDPKTVVAIEDNMILRLGKRKIVRIRTK